MRINITYISKLEFLYIFKEAFFTSITEKNIQGGFTRASLVPYDPERVISVRKKGVLARGQNTIWAKVLEMPRTIDW